MYLDHCNTAVVVFVCLAAEVTHSVFSYRRRMILIMYVVSTWALI